MKPIIGLSLRYSDDMAKVETSAKYMTVLEHMGALPILLPEVASEKDAEAMVSLCDGLLFTGGGDMHPSYYGEEKNTEHGKMEPSRDEFEVKLFKAADALNMPMLGICRGCQVLNIMLGGSIHQHMVGHTDGVMHKIAVYKNSPLYEVLGSEVYTVNSYHHQAIKRPAPGTQVMARAADGIIEAFRDTKRPFLWGFQWHPEMMFVKDGDEKSAGIFGELVKAAEKYKK